MRNPHLIPPVGGVHPDSANSSNTAAPDPMGEWLIRFRELEAKAEAAYEENPDLVGPDNPWNRFLGDLFAEAVASPPVIGGRESAAGALEVIAQDLSALGPIQDAIGRALAAYLGANWTPTPWAKLGEDEKGRGPAPEAEIPPAAPAMSPFGRPILPELLAWFKLEEAAQDFYWARYTAANPKTQEEIGALEDWYMGKLDAFIDSIRPEPPRIYSFATAARAWSYLDVEAGYSSGTWWRAVAVELGDFLRLLADTQEIIDKAHKSAKREG